MAVDIIFIAALLTFLCGMLVYALTYNNTPRQ